MSLTLTAAKKRILRAIVAEPVHGYALAKELGVRGSTIYEHLDQLEEHGYIRGEADGRRTVYSPTRKGELIVEAERQKDH
jgi:DNA-binding MarR family transcriptional regulator